MDTLGTVRLIAAVTSVTAAVMIALNVSARVTVLGFGAFNAVPNACYCASRTLVANLF